MLLCAWLPTTHAAYWQRYRGRLIDLATVASGTWLGLAVPDYVDIDSIDQLRGAHARFGNRIVGIDAGAGLMLRARAALDSYRLHEMQLLTSSTVAMQSQLSRAIERRHWIVVTAWKPLGIWSRHALKPLADPAGVFGSGDRIDTLITPSLPRREPRVVDLLRRFQLPLGDIEAMMVRLEDGVPPARVTSDWIDAHADDVARWTHGA
ncbi:glycine betaine-binding protein OpuAC precursor [mine drainage metagenome]|uniref:Glycine betaine-binding protein OpuAC n=1 Tax=mine drainage metagenome TaxID=410659 RepID=A0A1J5PEF4_9ZZZZ